MPVMDGLEATKIITSKFPDTKVIIFSAHTDECYLNSAYQAGACILLPKDCTKNELLKTIKDCCCGGRRKVETVVG